MGESTQPQLQETNPDNFNTTKMSVNVDSNPKPPPETFLFILFSPSIVFAQLLLRNCFSSSAFERYHSKNPCIIAGSSERNPRII